MPLLEPLDTIEARVLGVLVEKALTTPDQYPLTLNALTNGCNQKSNRDPVMGLTDADVTGAIDRLRLQQLVGEARLASSRVVKYRHTACEKLGFEGAPLAVLVELLLRNRQAPGDLRARASRMAALADQAALSAALKPLMDAGMVVRCAPAPGSRVSPYAHTLSGPVSAPAMTPPISASAVPPPPVSARPAASPQAPAPSAFQTPDRTPDWAPPTDPTNEDPDSGHAVPVTFGAAGHASADLIVRVSTLEDEVKDLRYKLERLSERLKVPLE